jgi:hypothetical protein
MRSLLASPRRRRRLGWTLGLALALAIVVGVSVRYSTSGSSAEDTPVQADAAETASPQAAAIRVTPAVRREVDRTVQTFVRTAVIRRDLAEGWALASPVMRQGVTRSAWEDGDIPVQPFPARALASADWQLRYRFERTLGIDVLVQPKQGSGAPVAVYAAEVTAPGSGAPRRFLVDSWVPQATLGAASGPSQPRGGGSRAATPELASDQGRLGAEWFLVPAAIVLMLFLVLGAFGVRSVVRARRAERRYREQFRRS